MPSRDDFLLRGDIIFFNHGSFGACPKPVFARYQAWQLELERQPIDFLLRRRGDLMRQARARIAEYFNVAADEIVFVTNVTEGMSKAVRSLVLQPGDEILTSDHEYGAVNRLLDFVAGRTGARVVRSRVRLPYSSDAAFVEDLFADATDKTRAIVISHITSPTSLIFPVKRICQRRPPARHPDDRRRRPRARPAAARPHGNRRGHVRRQFSQVALRAKRSRLPARPARTS